MANSDNNFQQQNHYYNYNCQILSKQTIQKERTHYPKSPFFLCDNNLVICILLKSLYVTSPLFTSNR